MFTSYQETITMATVKCCNCGIVFGMPSDFKERCLNNPMKFFYCPNGHDQHYSKSKEVLLREEAEKKLRDKEIEHAHQLANMASEKIQLESQLKTHKRDLKRLTNGVCPCCNRTFSNLHNHMKKQHPEAVL